MHHKMSTMNLGNMLSLKEDTKHLSFVRSDGSLNLLVDEVVGLKSESEVKRESEAKQKKVNQLVTLAEKVTYSEKSE